MFVIPARGTTATPMEVEILIFINVLSFFACLFIIACTYLPGQSMRIYNQFARNIAISDMMQSVGYIFGPGQTGAACEFQGVIIGIFQLSWFFWIVCLSHTIFSVTVLHQRPTTLNLWHHGICWGLSLFLCLIPSVFDKSVACATRLDDLDYSFCASCSTLSFWITFGIPVVLAQVIIFVLLAVSYYKMWTLTTENRLWRYFLYVPIGVIIWWGGIVPGKLIHGMYLASSQGFLCCMVFWFIEDEVREVAIIVVISNFQKIRPQFFRAVSSDELESSDDVFRVHTQQPPTSSVVAIDTVEETLHPSSDTVEDTLEK